MGARRAGMAVMHRRGLVAEHRRRGDGGNAAPGRPAGDDVEPAGERRLFPTVHKAGQPGVGPMSGDAVAAMIQRRAAAAGYTPTQVNLLGGHLLRSGFVTEAFRAATNAHSILRQTGHRDPKMLEVYAREFALGTTRPRAVEQTDYSTI